MLRICKRFVFLVLIFQSAWLTSVQAQGLNFNHQVLSVEDGLGSREVLCGLQDKRGFLWFGTRNGLNRFDGQHFTLLTKRDGLQRNRVVNLAEDHDGNLWIAYGLEEGNRKADGIIDIYNPVTRELKPLKEKFPDAPFDKAPFTWMVPNKQGEIYFLTLNNLVFRYRTGKGFEKVANASGAADKLKTDLNFNPIANGDGIAFNERNLFYNDRFLSNENYRHSLSYFNDEGGLEIVAVAKNSNQRQLLIEKYIPNGQHTTERKPCDSLTYAVLNNLDYYWGHWNEKFGSSIILPLKMGLFLFKDYACTRLETGAETENGFSSNLSYFTDRQGIYWVCTASGLHKFSPQPKRFQVLFNKAAFDTRDPLGNQIRAIYADDSGNIWAGGHFGLVYYNKKTGKYQSRLNISDDAWIHCFDKRADKLYFFGSGLSYIDYQGMELGDNYALKTNLSAEQYLSTIGFVWATFPLSNDRYLLGNHLGGFMLWNSHDNSFKNLESCGSPVDFSNYILKIIYSPKDQHYWAVGGSGCYRISKEFCVTDYYGTGNIADEKYRLPVADLRDIYEDAAGVFWLATNGEGLLRWDRKNADFQAFTIQDGMPSNTLYCIQADDFDNLWVSTDNGLVRFNKSTHYINIFTTKDGIAHNEFNRVSSFKAADGTLYFGGIDGLTAFHPRDFETDKSEEYIQLQVTNFSQFLRSEDALMDMTHELLTDNAIIMRPGDKFFRLEFAMLDYRSSGSFYKYQIEGFDKEWQYIAEPLLRISGLPYGDYTLRIAGQSYLGALAVQDLVIPIHVLRPFYLTWWAFTLYGLAFITFLYLFRKNQVKRALEAADKQRLQELDLLKTKLYTNITHEFRTPLTVISGMASMIEKPENAKKLILKSSDSLLRLVNQMLDLAKLESGHFEPAYIQADAVGYAQYLTESYQSFAAKKNINLVFYKETDHLVMDMDEKMMESILTNLLSNAIKFSKENGKIIVHVKEESGRFLIKIKDNGIGISPDKLPHIFDRFYQVEDTVTRKGEGTGIGLALTKELVALLGGEITVKSQPGEGTEFRVSLPIHHQALAGEIPIVMREVEEWPATESVLTMENKGDQHPDMPLLLLIEDNEDVATYIKACVQERYTVEWAANGAIGIERALETIPDIILSDVMMPQKDGYEVCQTLKNDERTNHIPIILLTAKTAVESRLEGLGVGADAYLSKPFLKEELFIWLEKLIALRQTLQEKYSRTDFNAKAPAAMENPTVIASDSFLQKASNFILEQLGNAEFGNEELARKIGMSESQLNRKIKALTGKTLSIFIRSIRLKEAENLLQTTDLNISEIAYSVGFADPSYFTRTFTQEFGVTPKSIRN